MRRGQGSLEYLLVLASILAIAVIIVLVANYMLGTPTESNVVSEDKYNFAVNGWDVKGYDRPFDPKDLSTLPKSFVHDGKEYDVSANPIPDDAVPIGTITDSLGNSHTVYVDDSNSYVDTGHGFTDSDGDGHTSDADCDDGNPHVWKAMQVYADADADGYGAGSAIQVCTNGDVPDGYSINGGDCDDSNPFAWRTVSGHTDNDGDGYGSPQSVALCVGDELPPGYTTDSSDCDDSNPYAHPGAMELCGNSVDEDCNGSDLACAPKCTDNDGDGYGSPASDKCTYAAEDCDDNNKYVHPGATEVCGNDIDDNCDGTIDEGCDCGGSGVIAIRNWKGLHNVADDLGGSFILCADLTPLTDNYSNYASETANDGKGWLPIGDEDNPFTGTLDGNGHTIAGLRIHNSDYVGLFAKLSSAKISDLTLVDVNITARDAVGALAGTIGGGTNISNSYFYGIEKGRYDVGGLAGMVWKANISDTYVASDVTGKAYVGGIVGYAKGTTILKSCSAGTILGSGDYIGGVGGQVLDKTKMEHACSTGKVSGNGFVGGLAGMLSRAAIVNSYSTGDISGERLNIGGIAGYADGYTISNSHSTGDVYGKGRNVGGIIGDAYNGHLRSSYATGSVSSEDNNVGGLVGKSSNDGVILGSHFMGFVSGYNYVGGIAGEFNGQITQSYCTGEVSGGSYVGGIAGEIQYAKISNSYSVAGISGSGNVVGGLIGNVKSHSLVSDSYSAGRVSGEESVGGFIGVLKSTTHGSYWDTEASGVSTSAGGRGFTTAEMTYDYGGADVPNDENAPYYQWDFDNVWQHGGSGEYPKLRGASF